MDSIESFFGQREFLPMNWWPIHYKWKIQKYLDKDDVVVVAVYCRILMMNRRCYDPCLIFLWQITDLTELRSEAKLFTKNEQFTKLIIPSRIFFGLLPQITSFR